MKKQVIRLISLAAISLIFLTTCDLFNKEGTLSTEEAKVEIRAASQELKSKMDNLMNLPASVSLNYLSSLVEIDKTLKSSTKTFFTYLRLNQTIQAHQYLKQRLQQPESNAFTVKDTGVYQFNFNTQEFDLINSNVNYLKLIYPENEAAANARKLNAAFTLSNVTVIEIVFTDQSGTYTEEFLTKANAALEIDGSTKFEASFLAAYNNQGYPTSTTMSIALSPYVASVTISGSGQNYKLITSFKKDDDQLLACNLDITYTSQLDDIEKLKGTLDMTPLQFSGSVNVKTLQSCGEVDINCRNNNMDVVLKHTGLKKIIGDIEFRLVYDSSAQQEVPQLVVVYEDGTWELLSDMMGN